MIIFSRLCILSATVLLVSSGAYAQSVETPARNSVTLNSQGYATLEKAPTVADVDFATKSKYVREAFKKREIRKQLDMKNLPPLVSIGDAPSKDRAR